MTRKSPGTGKMEPMGCYNSALGYGPPPGHTLVGREVVPSGQPLVLWVFLLERDFQLPRLTTPKGTTAPRRRSPARSPAPPPARRSPHSRRPPRDSALGYRGCRRPGRCGCSCTTCFGWSFQSFHLNISLSLVQW